MYINTKCKLNPEPSCLLVSFNTFSLNKDLVNFDNKSLLLAKTKASNGNVNNMSQKIKLDDTFGLMSNGIWPMEGVVFLFSGIWLTSNGLLSLSLSYRASKLDWVAAMLSALGTTISLVDLANESWVEATTLPFTSKGFWPETIKEIKQIKKTKVYLNKTFKSGGFVIYDLFTRLSIWISLLF